MSVTKTVNTVSYVGNGATTVFDFTFYIPDDSLEVYLTENETASLVASSQYTVAGLNDANGGSVRMKSAPTSAQRITILRSVPIVQPLEIGGKSTFYSEDVEEALDRQALISQQLAEELDRAVKVPVGSHIKATDYLSQTAKYADEAQSSAETAEQASVDAAKDVETSLAGYSEEAKAARDEAVSAASAAAKDVEATLASYEDGTKVARDEAVSAASTAAADVRAEVVGDVQSAKNSAETAQTLATFAEESASRAENDAAAVASALASISEDVIVVTSDTTLTAENVGDVIVVDASAGDVTVTLPLGVDVGEPWNVRVKKEDYTIHKVRVVSQGGDRIGGLSDAYEIYGQGNGARFYIDVDVDPDNWITASFGVAVGDATPVGTESWFSGTTPPDGWLVEDGAVLSREDYPDLWKHAQTSGMIVEDGDWQSLLSNKSKFSFGDGVSTFRLPDLITDRLFVRSDDPARASFGQREEDELKEHPHHMLAPFYYPEDKSRQSVTSVNHLTEYMRVSDNEGYSADVWLSSGCNRSPTVGLTSEVGGPETRPKNAGRLPIIKAFAVMTNVTESRITQIINVATEQAAEQAASASEGFAAQAAQSAQNAEDAVDTAAAQAASEAATQAALNTLVSVSQRLDQAPNMNFAELYAPRMNLGSLSYGPAHFNNENSPARRADLALGAGHYDLGGLN